MLLKATLGTLAGVIWLASAAVVPNHLGNALGTSCLGKSPEGAATAAPESTSSVTSLQQVTPVTNSNCSSTGAEQASEPAALFSHAPEVVTITVLCSTPCRSTPCSLSPTASALSGSLPANSPPVNSLSGQPGSRSSPCASSDASLPASQSTAVTAVTVAESTDLFTTVTVTLPAVSSTTADSAVPAATSEDSPAFVSVATVTVTIPAVSDPTATVTSLEPFGSEVTSVLTLTFPDGFRHTSTVLVTVTIPEVPTNSGLSSTVVTPSGVPTPLVTVGCSTEPSSPYRPYAVTYTLSPESGLPTAFTGTITVTPSSPPPRSMRSSGSVPLPNTVTDSLEPLTTASPASGVESDIVTVTIIVVGSPASVSQDSSATSTPVPYGSALITDPSTLSVTLSLATSTVSTVVVSETSGYGSIVSGGDVLPTGGSVSPPAITSTITPSSPVPVAPAPRSSETDSIVLVTYTVPGQSGIGASTYTVIYTQPTPTGSCSGRASGSVTSSDDALATSSGVYQVADTGSVSPTSGFNNPTSAAITGTFASASISAVTLSQTVPIGYSSSTVVEFTTVLSVAPSPKFPTASESPALATSVTSTSSAPSEVTIWPSPASDSSCSTLSTIYLSLTDSGTAPLFSITTLSPATSSAAPDGTDGAGSFTNKPSASCSGSDMPAASGTQPDTVLHHNGHEATDDAAAGAAATTLGTYDFSTASDGDYCNEVQSTAAVTTNPFISSTSGSPVSPFTSASSSPLAYGTTESVESNHTSTSLGSPVTGPGTTGVSQPGIASTTPSGVPSSLPASHSSLSVHSTTSTASTSASNQAFTTTSTLASVVTNTTTALSINSVSTIVSSTVLNSTAGVHSSISSSAIVNFNGTTSASPVISTVTHTTASISATVSGSLTTSTLVSFTSSLVVLTTVASSATISATSLPTHSVLTSTSAANGTSIGPTPPIVTTSVSSSSGITLVTSPSSVSLLSTTLPVVNSTLASTSSAIVSATVASSVSAELLNSTTLVTTTMLSSTHVPSTSLVSSTPIDTTVLTPSTTVAINSSSSLPLSSGTTSASTTLLSSTTVVVSSSSSLPVSTGTTSVPTTLSSIIVIINSSTSVPSSAGTTSVPTTLLSSTTVVVSPSSSLLASTGTTSVSTMSLESTSLAVTSTVPSSTSTLSGPPSSSTTAAASCGATEDVDGFVLNFDDIRGQQVPDPYHRFSFSAGSHVVSQQMTNSTPTSGSRMLQIDPLSGTQIGVRLQINNPCFLFALKSIRMGCTTREKWCTFIVTGLRWDGVRNTELGNEIITVQSCPSFSSCTLPTIALPPALGTGLTSFNIEPQDGQTSWIDDVQIGWTDNGCAAATCRSQVPNTAKRHIRWGVRG